MSSSGFVDEAPGADGNREAGRGGRRRAWRLGGFFTTVVLALLVFGGWAWTSRAHADDLAAFEVMRTEFDVMDRSLTSQRHSAIAPCREQPDGVVTRSYSVPDGPGVNDLVIYLKGTGWDEVASTPPAVVTLTRRVDGHGQSLTLVKHDRSTLPLSLTATSAGSTIGCLLR